MTNKFLSVLLFFLIVNATASAYYVFDKKLELAYTNIISFHFTEAEHLLNQEQIEKPGNDLCLLYFNYIGFLKAFVTEERTVYEKFLKKSADFSDKIRHDKSNEASPFHLYAQSEMLVQLALLKIKFGENITAANDMRKAYKLIKRNEILFPSFVLNKKISGLLNVLIGSVPGQYQWILNYAGIDGNITEGITELQELYDDAGNHGFSSYRPEILFYQGFISSVLSMQADSANLLNRMRPLIKSTPLIAYVCSNLLMKQGKNEEAIETLNVSLNNNTSYPFIFLHYKRGLARLRKLDLSAEKDFNTYLEKYKGVNNVKAVYQKLAWIALLKGDTADYKMNLSLCRQRGYRLIDEDKNAHDEAVTDAIINIYLLKSRLYFDGGYYNEALKSITERSINDFPTYNEQLEVTYRLGRILQMMGQTDKAILYYEKTLENGLSSKHYFAANSSLMLGQIYEEGHQYEKAKSFYRQTISIKHDQYKNSIDQKAKAGLERIKIKESGKK